MSDPTNTHLHREVPARNTRRDTITISIFGAYAAISVVVFAIIKFRELFVASGISWSIPVQAQSTKATGLPLEDAGTAIHSDAVTGMLTHVQVIVPGVSTVATLCIGASILIGTLAALTLIWFAGRLLWLFLSGSLFTTRANNTLSAMIGVIGGGGIAMKVAWSFGTFGIEDALGVRATDEGITLWFWYGFFAALGSLGIISSALRRAIRLQNETVGLV